MLLSNSTRLGHGQGRPPMRRNGENLNKNRKIKTSCPVPCPVLGFSRVEKPFIFDLRLAFGLLPFASPNGNVAPKFDLRAAEPRRVCRFGGRCGVRFDRGSRFVRRPRPPPAPPSPSGSAAPRSEPCLLPRASDYCRQGGELVVRLFFSRATKP